MNWMHLAAMNLIARHDSGEAIEPAKLEVARALMARAKA